MSFLTATLTQWRQAPGFIGAALLLFITSAVITVVWSVSMATYSAMPMLWLPMCGQSWHALGAYFLGMWSVMMVAMMLPSLLPMLWQFRETVRGVDAARLAWLTVVAGSGYFFVWILIGLAVFALGISAVAIQIQLPALTRFAPLVVGVVVMSAGAVQFTRWKARHLACCRATLGTDCMQSPEVATAWRHGLRLGRHCVYCCGNLMALLLVVGMMNLPAMIIVTTAMTAERLAPAGLRVEHAIGLVVTGAGLYMIMAAPWQG